ncbi:MAG: TPM domain-containing protein [Rhodospirillaceae bacterium]|nr:TPM domain-containing protein [Rhodospirillaceae bacterium]
MKYIFAFLIFCLSSLSSPNIFGAPPTYPSLTGRVVDQAGILTPAQKDQLSIILEKHEQKTSNQVVVAIVRSLEGHDIAEYAVGLLRHWQLGVQGQNNGVLLLISIDDREVDIEVGYGLEGTLTDAISHDIIQEKIIPFFKKGEYEAGIFESVNSIMLALDGGYIATGKAVNQKENDDEISWFVLGPFLFFFLIMFFIRNRRGGGGGGFPNTMMGPSSSNRSRSSGFSGRGGSSGGGGARGKW